MKVALYTDAGVKDRLATWAVVALGEGMTTPFFEASGRLRVETDCSATAECRAIANALHTIIRRGYVSRGDEVRVYSDSMNAVGRISGRMTRRPEHATAKAALVIHKLAETHGLTVSAQWVKGHRPNDADQHARWNNRCDALCRAARKLPPVPTKARRALASARRLANGGAA